MITVVGGIKGGTGKSSLLSHLATFAATDARVLVIDADPQKTLTCWADARNSVLHHLKGNPITTISLRGSSIGAEVLRLSEHYDYTFIDSDGQDGGTQRAALLVADLFITPFSPTAQDIWTADQVSSLINGARAINTSLEAIAVLNQCDGRSKKRIAEAREVLSEFKDSFVLLPFEIGDRADISLSFSDGFGIGEVKKPNEKAINEISQLWDFVRSRKGL